MSYWVPVWQDSALVTHKQLQYWPRTCIHVRRCRIVTFATFWRCTSHACSLCSVCSDSLVFPNQPSVVCDHLSIVNAENGPHLGFLSLVLCHSSAPMFKAVILMLCLGNFARVSGFAHGKHVVVITDGVFLESYHLARCYTGDV